LVQLDASAKLPAVDGSQLTNLPIPTQPNGLLKIASAMSSTLQTVSDYLNNLGVLQLSNRRVGVLQDSGVTTQTSSVIQATTTNANLVISPNGTGALVASIPDGTATGGNARGSKAVDFSLSRISNISVASGNNSGILSGFNNRASGASSSITGGDNNVASNQYTHIGGGTQNTTSGEFSTIAGGFANTASSNLSGIVGGQSNISSGQYAVSGGFSNTASGRSSVCFGETNTANSSYGVALGNQSKSYLQSQQSLASGLFSVVGDAQQSLLTARRSAVLTTGLGAALSLDGTGVTNLIIPESNNRAWNVTIDTISVVTAITGTATGVSVGDCYSETKKLLFKRIGGTSSIVGTVDTSAIKSDLGMATASITISAGGSQQMAITFTAPTFVGGGSVTCRVVSKVMLVEVAY
jgi:hypothetical protein